MSNYRIELKLDGTILCVSLLDADAWGAEVSGDNVDLAPLINAAKAEGMREAAEIASQYIKRTYLDLGEVDRGVEAAILSAIGGQK